MRGTVRVAFIAHSRRLYGASRSLLVLLEGFRAAGIEAHTIISGSGQLADTLTARGFDMSVVPFAFWVRESSTGGDAAGERVARARAAASIARRLDGVRPDVVWTNTSVTEVGALAAAALGIPHVWHLREINVAPSAYRFVVDSREVVALMRTAHTRIAVSDAVRATYEALGSGPCDVVYNGIGTASELAGRRGPLRRSGPLRLLLPGRVQRNKGQLAAVGAVRRLIAAGYDVRLRIAGDGDLEPVAAAIARFGLEAQVTLVGFVADLDAEYRAADVVLSCGTLEAMGRVTAEAMSYALPVIGCADGGTLDLLEHDVTGLLCDGTDAGIADAVECLVRDPAMRRRIGARAHRVAGERFTNERCVAASLAVLQRATAARALPDTPVSQPA